MCMSKFRETYNCMLAKEKRGSSLMAYYAMTNCERTCTMLSEYINDPQTFYHETSSVAINFFKSIIQPKPKKITNGPM